MPRPSSSLVRLLPRGRLLLVVWSALFLISPANGGLLSRPKRRPNQKRDYGVLGNLVVMGLDAAFGIKRDQNFTTTPEDGEPRSQNLTVGNETPHSNLTFGDSKAELEAKQKEYPAIHELGQTVDSQDRLPSSAIPVERMKEKLGLKKGQDSAAVPKQETNAPSRRWRASADRFRKLVEPFLLQFKSPDEKLVEALGRLKNLEAEERVQNPRYIGGLSEL